MIKENKFVPFFFFNLFIKFLLFINLTSVASAEILTFNEIESRFEKISKNWTCDIKLEEFKNIFLETAKRNHSQRRLEENQQKFSEIFSYISESELNLACMETFKQNAIIGFEKVYQLNPQLISDIFQDNYGNLVIKNSLDCGGIIAAACYIPNRIFKGGTMNLSISTLMVLLSKKFPQLKNEIHLESCEKESTSKVSNDICQGYYRRNTSAAFNNSFHELLHYFKKFDNLSLNDHMWIAKFKDDVVYSCSNVAFPHRGWPHQTKEGKFFFSKEQCQTCEYAELNANGKISVNKNEIRENDHCSQMDYSEYKE